MDRGIEEWAVTTCGTSGLHQVNECEEAGTVSWQRWAAPDEVDTLHQSGDLPLGLDEASLLVLACPPHAVSCGIYEEDIDGNLSGTEKASQTHAATCLTPEPAGDCDVCGRP